MVENGGAYAAAWGREKFARVAYGSRDLTWHVPGAAPLSGEPPFLDTKQPVG